MKQERGRRVDRIGSLSLNACAPSLQYLHASDDSTTEDAFKSRQLLSFTSQLKSKGLTIVGAVIPEDRLQNKILQQDEDEGPMLPWAGGGGGGSVTSQMANEYSYLKSMKMKIMAEMAHHNSKSVRCTGSNPI